MSVKSFFLTISTKTKTVVIQFFLLSNSQMQKISSLKVDKWNDWGSNSGPLNI
jgi:hypothetical protein